MLVVVIYTTGYVCEELVAINLTDEQEGIFYHLNLSGDEAGVISASEIAMGIRKPLAETIRLLLELEEWGVVYRYGGSDNLWRSRGNYMLFPRWPPPPPEPWEVPF